MCVEGLNEELRKIHNAFPDFNFVWEHIEERSNGEVVVHKMVPSGHHAGAPCALGPCEPIEATGKFVKSDPIALVHSE